jgi:uncharacterized membrane protein HdeD (DUF308 family)
LAHEIVIAAGHALPARRVLRGSLATLFVMIGSVPFLHRNAAALLAVLSFYVVFRGAIDIATTPAASTTAAWRLLLAGLLEMGLGAVVQRCARRQFSSFWPRCSAVTGARSRRHRGRRAKPDSHRDRLS